MIVPGLGVDITVVKCRVVDGTGMSSALNPASFTFEERNSAPSLFVLVEIPIR